MFWRSTYLGLICHRNDFCSVRLFVRPLSFSAYHVEQSSAHSTVSAAAGKAYCCSAQKECKWQESTFILFTPSKTLTESVQQHMGLEQCKHYADDSHFENGERSNVQFLCSSGYEFAWRGKMISARAEPCHRYVHLYDGWVIRCLSFLSPLSMHVCCWMSFHPYHFLLLLNECDGEGFLDCWTQEGATGGAIFNHTLSQLSLSSCERTSCWKI